MSCNCAQTICLTPYKVGTTWCGLSGITVSPAHDEALESVTVEFIKSGTVIQTLTNGDGVTITDATSWAFDIDAQVLSIPVGSYSILITTTDTTGYIRKPPSLNIRAI